MKKGSEVIAFAKQFIGSKYVLGAVVPKNNGDFKGAFDCAELVAFSNFQTFGMLYGTDTHDVAKASIADAYTGYFKKDAQSLGRIIPVELASRTPGAMLLRYPAPGAVGHIVFSQGNGKTMEANCTKYGCGEFDLKGRHFDVGVLLPGIDYDVVYPSLSLPKLGVIYKLTAPAMNDPYIKKIQTALGIEADGVFGLITNNAVVEFQKKNGLVVDGQVMAGGQTSKALKI